AANEVPDGGAPAAAARPWRQWSRQDLQREAAAARDLAATSDASARLWGRWHAGLYVLKAALPKTSDTISLMDRTLFGEREMESFGEQRGAARQRDELRAYLKTAAEDEDGEYATYLRAKDLEHSRLRHEFEGRSTLWAIGTSLAFEALVLGVAAWVFCRRDY
ncbi:MAG TPA: hypothetical protein VF796_07840, partial [Humisphaera sp.]